MLSAIKYLLNREISTNRFIVIVASYLVCILNIPFLSKTLNATLTLDEYSILFLLSVPLLLLCLFILIIGVFSWSHLIKPLSLLLIIISSLLFYSTINYGIIFDYGMIQNTVETDRAEAFSYVNPYALLFVFCTGVLPAIGVWLVNIKVKSPLVEIAQRIKLFSFSIIAMTIIGYFFYSDYASIGRNNRVLTKYIIPFQFIDASYKYAKKNYFSSPLPFEMLDVNPQSIDKSPLNKKVVVMVVGETARAMSFSYNGYIRNTNPYTKKDGLISFSNMFSCGTATAVSVPCMFSFLTKANFDKRIAINQQNLLDVVHLAGTDVLWIDNNGSCKGVCNRVPSVMIPTDKTNPRCDGDYCFDEVLVDELKGKLQLIDQPSTLIVLHMMGSHGPTYYRRYPKEYSPFLPDCQQSDIQNCSQEQLVNTYDNTIAYTDLVLSQIIDELEKLSMTAENIETSLLYVSDHGESLGEKGVYLHGLPYAFAPEEQTHIPMLFWQNSQQVNMLSSCMSQYADEHYDHDNIFHSMLGLLHVDSKSYDYQQDIFSVCHTGSDIRLSSVPAILSPSVSAIGNVLN